MIVRLEYHIYEHEIVGDFIEVIDVESDMKKIISSNAVWDMSKTFSMIYYQLTRYGTTNLSNPNTGDDTVFYWLDMDKMDSLETNNVIISRFIDDIKKWYKLKLRKENLNNILKNKC